jgi:hypothetical protein
VRDWKFKSGCIYIGFIMIIGGVDTALLIATVMPVDAVSHPFVIITGRLFL